MLYFETIPPIHRSLILVGGLSFFWVLENNISLFEGPHTGKNFLTTEMINKIKVQLRMIIKI